MTVHRRVGSRAPLIGLTAALVTLLLLPTTALGADWTKPERVTSAGSSRLDSMHQLASAKGVLHLVHPRVGPRTTDDRVIYQRSGNKGKSWSAPKVLFKATKARRTVVPNLALDARNRVVVVAFRVSGPRGHSLFVRTSRNSGRSFGPRVEVFSTTKDHGVGVPAVAIGNDVIAVAWTNRANGRVKIRTSRDGGSSFGRARTLATTKLSIDCRKRLTDGLVGLAISGTTVHLAWSHAPTRACYATAIRVRTSPDRGKSWSPVRTITKRDSFGWPELDARANTVVATVQGTKGQIIFARSGYNGRKWRDHVSKPPRGRSYSAADVALGANKSAWLSYVNERIRNGKLVSTRVITRRSNDDGASYGAPKPVTRDHKALRQAANITVVEKRPVLVVQSGALDGSPRHIYSSRYR
jgi:hypothetical protein